MRNAITLAGLLVFLFFSFIITSCNNGGGDTQAPVTISPQIPVDVDSLLQEQLKKEGDIYSLNQRFNEFSWQAFIAIFWPRDAAGNPKPNFTDEGRPTWLGWKEAYQVYRKDGGKPRPWDSARTGGGLMLTDLMLKDADARLVLSTSTPTHGVRSKNFADETDQAFAGKLFDQNGNIVVYEALMNQAEFNYVVTNQLYNINGQIEFSKNNSAANFPAGNYKQNQVGAIEIKLAWKILGPNDHKERYYINHGYILDTSTNKYVKKELGMIGFHISQKTPTGKQWVWSTFEQIDNLTENVIMKDGKRTIIHPTLTDPACETCPVNVDVTNGGTSYTYNTSPHGSFWTISGDHTDQYYANSAVMKTQSKRMVDIPVRVQELNRRMQAFFRSQNSVWQYYQLIDTQYPLDQNAAPDPNDSSNYKLAGSVTNKPGGKPNISFLTNISMETFFQLGNQNASNLMEGNPTSNITIFGTESCMGCHSSAGIYDSVSNGQFLTSGQLSGDFSWLLSLRAQWDTSKPIPAKANSVVKKTH